MRPERWSIVDGRPKPTAPTPSRIRLSTISSSSARSFSWDSVSVGRSITTQDPALAVDDTGGDLRPADVDPDGQVRHVATIVRPWPRERSPIASTAEDASKGVFRRCRSRSAPTRRTDRKPPRFKGPGPKPQKPKGKPNWRRRILIGVLVFFVLLLVWGVASYLALRSGAKEANERLPDSAKAALVPQDGLMLSNPSVTLLLGTDHSSRIRTRTGFRRADSIMLLRTDPGKGRLNYLSIPRDLRVNVPGHGFDKINVAYQLGGPSLAIRTVRSFTDVEVNHVVVVDFDAFTEVIDKVGGVDIDVPAPILSNKFDCPYATQARCDRWQGWRFARGKQHMDGQRARVYARIRENKLNPAESDITRTERQQAVIQALLSKLTSPGVLLKMPFIGDDVMKPLTTDLSAGELIQLGLVKKRSGNERRCRLGGTPELRELPPARRGGSPDGGRIHGHLGAAASASRLGLRVRLPGRLSPRPS